MQVLLDYFRGHMTPETLPITLPQSPSAELSYTKALSRSRDYLGSDLFGSNKRCAMLGILVRDWMAGHPLARLIEARLRYTLDKPSSRKFDPPTIIRETMDDVEQIARFGAPRYLACYNDVLAFHLAQQDERPVIDTETLTMMLELGVSRPTEVSLMSLGLSRTSAVALSEFIVPDELTPDEALAWLREQHVDRLPVPVLVRSEIATVLALLPER